MSRDTSRGTPTRSALVWLTATSAVVVALAVVRPELDAGLGTLRGTTPTPRFDDLLASGGALVLLACAAWGWLVATLVVLESLGRPLPRGRRVAPPAVRRTLLAACGVCLVAGMAPAAADPGRGPAPPAPPPAGSPGPAAVVGLPLPERPNDEVRHRAAPTRPRTAPGPVAGATALPAGARVVRVRPGDTLWGIARDALGPDAHAADVARHWPDIWRTNRTAIGPDPDLIHPDTTLQLPD